MLYSIIIIKGLLMKKYLVLAITLITTAQIGFCATEAVNEDLHQALKATSSSEPGIFSILMALIFVICLIYITGLIYSKLNIMGAKTVKEQLKGQGLSNVIVLSTTSLGQGKNLHVIEINNSQMLIAATPNSINLIKELSEKNEIENISKPEKKEEETIAEEFDLHKKYL